MKESYMVGESPALKKLHNFIQKAANSDSNVLIIGESGVGKELAANAIHYESIRKHKPLIKLNCGDLNENLLESELFGHKKGSFTGAFGDKQGLIEEADGGTFFFDEIGDICPTFQAKLLTVVEQKELRRVGENMPRKIDARFIFATNRDLARLVAKGKFRIDLFYRINILTFYIPPLRERKEDVSQLIEYIMKQECARKSAKFSITKEAKAKLLLHSYPGNVRELQNILRRACDLATSEILFEEDISFQGIPQLKPTENRKCGFIAVIEALRKSCGNKSKAAKMLGISRVQLYRILGHETTTRDPER